MGYLEMTRDRGIRLGATCKSVQIQVFVDAAHGVHHDGKSHSGIFISLGLGPIYAGSSKQKIITKSSFEAEVVAVSDAGSPVVWVFNLLEELGYRTGPAILFQDNSGAVAALKSGEAKGRNSKHIRIRQLWIVENIRNVY